MGKGKRANNTESKARERNRVTLLLFSFLFFVCFFACNNSFDSAENGYGKIKITFTEVDAAVADTARTVFPSTVFSKFEYTFFRGSETAGEEKSPDGEGFFTLETGTYTVAVQAYAGSGEACTLAASGVSAPFKVGPGGNEPVKVALSPAASSAQGEFSYTVTYPTGAAAVITLQKWPGLEDVALNPAGLSQGNGITQTVQLDAGSYLLSVLVRKGELHAGINEAVHVYPLLSTAYAKNFSDSDLLADPEPVTAGFTVVLYPRGRLDTYVGVPAGERIQFRAEAYRADGTVIEDATGFEFSGGGVDPVTGVFTPQAAGNAVVTASLDGVTASADVAVHPADYMRQPYYYPGTGKTYNGYVGAEGSLTAYGGVTVTYPAAVNFSADGFFTLEGSVNNSAVFNYALVRLAKDSDSANLTSTYLVRDNFKQRIWLRFGEGDYTVTVYGLVSITLSSELGAEGDYMGCSYYTPGLAFKVTNTRNDDLSADYSLPDKRFIYPSYVVQSDDFRITNLAADLAFGLADDTAIIRAIHDYIVKNTVYDNASTVTSRRKKQDAVTVLGTRYTVNPLYNPGGHYLAVCEGYANTFAALARAAGFEVKYISSSSMGHGWNNVYTGGGWKFIDVTWDDPSPDGGPGYTRYTYFLLNSLNGVSNDHYGWSQDEGRFLFGSAVPSRRGAPDGWY